MKVRKRDTRLEKKSLYLVSLIFIITTAILVYLIDKSDKTVPLLFILLTGLAYFIFTLINAEAVMGLRNALILKLIVIIVTFTGEFLGVNYGWIFGSYYYTNALGPKLLGVPFIVLFIWDVYIYTSYMLVLHILNFRITKKIKDYKKTLVSFLVAIITGIATVAMDLMIDPVAITSNWWVWRTPGEYFPSIAGGVPISNFLGWIFLTTLSIFIFKRFFETPFTGKQDMFEYAGVMPYIASLIGFIAISSYLKLYGPMFIGITIMSLFLIFLITTIIKNKYGLPKRIYK